LVVPLPLPPLPVVGGGELVLVLGGGELVLVLVLVLGAVVTVDEVPVVFGAPVVPVTGSGGGFRPGMTPLVPVTAPTAGDSSLTSAAAADSTAVVRVGSRPPRPIAKKSPKTTTASTAPATASRRLPAELTPGTSPYVRGS
jgi:hypothetical protein